MTPHEFYPKLYGGQLPERAEILFDAHVEHGARGFAGEYSAIDMLVVLCLALLYTEGSEGPIVIFVPMNDGLNAVRDLKDIVRQLVRIRKGDVESLRVLNDRISRLTLSHAPGATEPNLWVSVGFTARPALPGWFTSKLLLEEDESA